MLKPDQIPISLYIHTPWCIKKCPYCDFNSHALKDELPEQNYLAALLEDFKQQMHLLQGRAIQSIFIGGGTPSLLSADFYKTLLNTIQKEAELTHDCEITLEANPGTVEQSRFEGYRLAGINRISLGIQSFQENQLKKLGRIHSSNEAIKAIDIAKSSGFDNINIDLMYGLPNQTLKEALLDLTTGIELETTHLSWYHLTIEPNTLFYKFPPPLPEDDLIVDIELAGRTLLKENAFDHYEISAYAKADYQCRHNLNYWTYGDYLGIGAGAHAKVTLFDEQSILRYSNYKNPKDYLDPTKPYKLTEEIVNDRAFEFMLNALRLQSDIPISLFEERTGLSFEAIAPTIRKAEEENFISIGDNTLLINPLGRTHTNDLMALFLV